jgi:hypothetical protein
VSAVLLVLVTGTAYAQTAPTVNPGGPGTVPAQGPLTVGAEYRIQVDSAGHSDVHGFSTKTGRVYVIEHEGATYISIHFSRFDLAPGERVIISDPLRVQSYTMTGHGKLAAGTFWAQHIKGDTAILEYVIAAPQLGKGFIIDKYAAGFATVGGSQTSAICGVNDLKNAVCYRASNPIEYERGRAVARLLINGVDFCTGWLASANNHLLTNEHCISSPTDALNTDYEFGAEAPNCNDPNCEYCFPGSLSSGATFIKGNPALDYALVQIAAGNPAGSFGFLEIESRPPVLGEQIYIPQHPGGRAKEFGIESSENTAGVCRVDSVTEPGCSSASYNDVGYNCDTQGGSSGSPVLAASSHKVIALHHCEGNSLNCGGPILDAPNRGVPMNRICCEISEDVPCTYADCAPFDDCSLVQITSPDPQPEDYFGRDVDMWGDTVVIGNRRYPLPLVNPPPTTTGSAYVYRCGELQELIATEQLPSFGWAVAVHSCIAVITARDARIGGLGSAGAAFVFRFDGNTWVEEQMLTPSDPIVNGGFGSSVDIDGNVIVIGKNRGGEKAAYVFRFDGQYWVQEQKLTSSRLKLEPDNFGESVAINGNLIVVGSPSGDYISADPGYSGYAEVFHYDGTAWFREQRLTASIDTIHWSSGFGSSIAAHDETIIVGMPGDGGTCTPGVLRDLIDQTMCESGSARVYGYNGSVWQELQKLVAPDQTSRARFGSVAFDGDTALIGAPGARYGLGGCNHLSTFSGCNDYNPCTVDLCDPSTGCQSFPTSEGAPCGDPYESVCDDPDACDGMGQCELNWKQNGSPCPGGTCRQGVCYSQSTLADCQDSSQCSNGNICDGVELCVGDHCQAGMPLSCDDHKPCTRDVCDPVNGCEHPNVPQGTVCGDSHEDQCDGPDVCDSAGFCAKRFAAYGASCSDGHSCNGDETCTFGGTCSGRPGPSDCCSVDSDCDNHNLCRRPFWYYCGNTNAGAVYAFHRTPNGWMYARKLLAPQPTLGHYFGGSVAVSRSRAVVGALGGDSAFIIPLEADGAICDDGDACNVGETCQTGVCAGGTAPDCSALGDQCNVASCDPAGIDGNCSLVTSLFDGTPCDDGMFCTVNDSCTGGACGGSGRDCSSAGNQCNAGVCNELLDTCEARPVEDGTSCNDGMFCNGVETCIAGECVIGTQPCAEDEWCNEHTEMCLAFGDADADGDVDLSDFAGFTICFTAPFDEQGYVPPSEECRRVFDRDRDGDIDDDDFVALFAGMTGPTE